MSDVKPRVPPAKHRVRVKGEVRAELRALATDVWNVLAAWDMRVGTGGLDGLHSDTASPATINASARAAHTRWRLSNDPASPWVLAALDELILACSMGERAGGYAKGVREKARRQVNELVKAREVELGTWEPPKRTWKPVRKMLD